MKQDFTKTEYDYCKITNVTFGIRGENLEPEEINQKLTISPSRYYKKGDIAKSKVRDFVRSYGIWQYSSENVVNSLNPENHALHILEKLIPVKEAIHYYVDSPDYVVYIYIWWETIDTGGGFIMSPETLSGLCELCNGMNFTFIGTCEES